MRMIKQVEMELLQPQTDLLTFAILVRDYSEDEYMSGFSQQIAGCSIIVPNTVLLIFYSLKFI